jgi:hypothetical protein
MDRNPQNPNFKNRSPRLQKYKSHSQNEKLRYTHSNSNNTNTPFIMVSQLSARLLSLNRIENSSDISSNGSKSNREAKSTKSLGRSSTEGYTADMENSSSTGNTSCDSAQSGVVDVLPGHHKRESVSSIDTRDAKRRKTLEENYLASTVGFELARAGKSAPLVRSNPQVDHVQNKSLTTPFLVAQAPLKGIFQTDYCANMQNIISACSSFYQIPAETLLFKKETGIYREELCTSSVSGDSEDDNACINLSKADNTSGKPSFITMGDALSISMEPRYVSINRF